MNAFSWQFDLDEMKAARGQIMVTVQRLWTGSRHVYTAYVIDGRVIDYDNTLIENEYWRIVAWMPWPEPAQDEEMAET